MSESASKIYTKGGDKGKTSLIGGSRVSKAHARLDVYGTIDELNSFLGLLVHEIPLELAKKPDDARALLSELSVIQHDLFNVGSQLACEDVAMRSQLPGVDDACISVLEKSMDTFSSQLKPLKNFVLPGGSRAASVAHVCRTVCRRAERLCVLLQESGEGEVDAVIVRYINRLSDYLFVLARHLNHLNGVAEPIWTGKAK